MLDKILGIVNIGEKLADRIYQQIDKHEDINLGRLKQDAIQQQQNIREMKDALKVWIDTYTNVDVNASDRYERQDETNNDQ